MKIIGIVHGADHIDVVDLIVAGVDGFLLQKATSEIIANTIREVAEGENALPAEFLTYLYSQIRGHVLVKK